MRELLVRGLPQRKKPRSVTLDCFGAQLSNNMNNLNLKNNAHLRRFASHLTAANTILRDL